MLKCTLANGKTLYVNMDRVIKIETERSADGEVSVMSFLDSDGTAVRRRVQDFTTIKAGTVYKLAKA